MLALRGSGGLSLEVEWSERGLCAALSPVSFYCYLSHLVSLTLPKCKRNNRSWPEMFKQNLKNFDYFLVLAVFMGLWRYWGGGGAQK